MGLWCGLSELKVNIEAGIGLAERCCRRLEGCGLVGVGNLHADKAWWVKQWRGMEWKWLGAC